MQFYPHKSKFSYINNRPVKVSHSLFLSYELSIMESELFIANFAINIYVNKTESFVYIDIKQTAPKSGIFLKLNLLSKLN